MAEGYQVYKEFCNKGDVFKYCLLFMLSRYINNDINYTIGLDLVCCRARYKIIFLNSKISGLKIIRVIIDINIGARI